MPIGQAHSHTLTHNSLQLTRSLMLIRIVIRGAVDRVSGNMRGVGSSWVRFRDAIVAKSELSWHVKAIWRLGGRLRK